MHPLWLNLYHRLPPGVSSLAATARGFYLNSWRWGPETSRLVEEALERDTWTPGCWSQWQQERLTRLLDHAARRVPYYREQWAARRLRGDRRSWHYLDNWPILEREALRENPRAFLAEGCCPRRMFEERTSGTTGKPLCLWQSLDMVRRRYALYEARHRHWYGLTRHDRWALAGGRLVVAARRGKPPYWVWNQASRQLYLSSYHLSLETVPLYLGALRRFRPRYLMGYPSSLQVLAEGALRQGGYVPGIEVVITNSEPLLLSQRMAVEAAFGCPVRETYGMVEMAATAGECGHGMLHLWPEAGYVEVVEGGLPLAEGRIGDLVATGLLNHDMPLIRYRVGDRGALATPGRVCACGRGLPVLLAVDGRRDDVLRLPDGRIIGRLSPAFKASLPVREAQVVQVAADRLLVRYVPAPGAGTETGRSLLRQLRALVGEGIGIDLETLDAIPREANGKFRAVVSRIGPGRAEPSSPNGPRVFRASA